MIKFDVNLLQGLEVPRSAHPEEYAEPSAGQPQFPL